MLPTPDANYFNDGQSVEAYLERKRRELAKGYNGNGGGTALAMAAKLMHEGIDADEWKRQLLPTPSASDHTGGEGETRAARQEAGRTGGASLRDLEHLLPTPTTQDSANTAGPSQHERNSEPLNVVATKLLPTPTTNPKPKSERARRPFAEGGHSSPPGLVEEVQLLPTPMANDENPGAGGELRAAITHGPGRRNETGVDSMGRPNHGRAKLLPTPTSSEANDGPSNKPGLRGGGPSLREEIRLLPTPVVTDSFGSRRSTARTEEWESNEGTTLTDAIWEVQGRETDTTGKLLPTPQSADGSGGRDAETVATGRRPSGTRASLTAVDRDSSGELTGPRFGAGRGSSAGELLGQLTIEDV